MRKKLFVLCVIAIAAALLLTACAGADLTLTFEAEGQVYATVKTNGQETIQMPKEPRKKGYIFVGWYWDKDVWKKPFSSNSLLNAPITENGTVYAKWEAEGYHKHVYEMKFNLWSHWRECTVCGFAVDREIHKYENNVCTVCGKEYETESLKYKKSEGGYEVAGIRSSGETEIVIPSSHEGEPVTAIGSDAFSGYNSLFHITFGSNITKIGDGAFSGCSSLLSIEIPSGVTSIGDNTFYGCISLTSFEIPNSVTSIGNEAFSGCGNLTNIEIPDSVTSIGDNAFYRCGSLTRMVIPNGVTSVGNNAFSWCESLTIYTEAAEKPSDWGSIGCPVVWDHNNNDVADDGYIYTIQNGLRYGIKDGSAVVVRQPSNLKEANIASEIVYKDTRYSVTSIGDDAFRGCGKIETITVAEGNTKYRSAGNCLIETSTNTLILGCKGSVIPNDGSVTGIGDYAFYGRSGLRSIEIPNGVTSIGRYAFSQCGGLTAIVIPDSVTRIGGAAFYECGSLQSIIIPNGVTSIEHNTFWGCGSLQSIVIPDRANRYNIHPYNY